MIKGVEQLELYLPDLHIYIFESCRLPIRRVAALFSVAALFDIAGTPQSAQDPVVAGISAGTLVLKVGC